MLGSMTNREELLKLTEFQNLIGMLGRYELFQSVAVNEGFKTL